MSCYNNINNTSGTMNPAVITSTEAKEICKKCYNSFIKNGCSSAFAKGVLANIYAESNFVYNILTWDGGGGRFGIGGGLIGFYYNGALPTLAKYIDKNTNKIDSLNNTVKNSNLPYPKTAASRKNCDYIMKTLKLSFPYTLEQQLNCINSKFINSMNAPKNSNSESESADWWIRKVEKPRDITDRWKEFGNTINDMLK